MASSKRNPIQEKKQIRDSMESARKLYNSTINQLVLICVAKHPDDESILRIKEVLRAIMAVESGIIITESGPFIWNYRDNIAKRDENFFLANDFKTEISAAKDKTDKKFREDEIAQIMRTLKAMYVNMTEPEKEVTWTHISQLLRAYAQFLGCEKKLRATEEEIRKLTNQNVDK